MRTIVAVLVAAVTLLVAVAPASARPTYFQVFTERYALTPSDRTYACGNCHFRWTGTGARNAFGTAVEQQLYVGKSITQALADVESVDSDGDGFTNVDEIVNFLTLPGYSCENFHEAVNAPSDYHTFITPMVASCLQPIDIRVAPSSVSFLTEAGDEETASVTIFNNGSDFPITVTSYALAAGGSPAITIAGPATPVQIPVGESITVDVTFAPVNPMFASATLKIASDDPDEPEIEVGISGFGFIRVLAPPADRAACFKHLDNTFRRYAKKHLKAWSRCYTDEVAGLACDVGRRDLAIEQAEQKLRAAIGGSKDRHCAGRGITPSLLGYPSSCGGGCGAIQVSSLSRLADCLICRQNEGRDEVLRSGLGTAPPDLPPNTVASSRALFCQKQILGGMEKGVLGLVKTLARCEVANVTASEPVECDTALAPERAALRAKVDAALARCADSTGVLACPFDGGASTCLGDASDAVGETLVDEIFGLEE